MAFPGYIIARIAELARKEPASADRITVAGHQSNGLYGVHQARVTMAGDPTTYRLIIAPADAPITINGQPIGDHFALPLGDR